MTHIWIALSHILLIIGDIHAGWTLCTNALQVIVRKNVKISVAISIQVRMFYLSLSIVNGI